MFRRDAIMNAQIIGRMYREMYGRGISQKELEEAAVTAFEDVCTEYLSKDEYKDCKILDTLYNMLRNPKPGFRYKFEDQLIDEFIRGYNKSTSNNIREIRIKSGYSLQGFAKAYGISKQRASSLELVGMPNIYNLLKLAKFFGCRVEDLIDKSGIDLKLEDAA